MLWKKAPEATVEFKIGLRSNREDPIMSDLAARAHDAMLDALAEFAKANGCEAFIPARALVKFRFKEGKR